uniref:Beta-lactamase n=1 Tax=Staphylococcus aureus TaxID=1280 RepID=A0A499S313_STAAU|nr:beta-lactamase [Staphylococcus aureus]
MDTDITIVILFIYKNYNCNIGGFILKKLIFLIAIALVLSACNSNSPHAKKLNDLEKNIMLILVFML